VELDPEDDAAYEFLIDVAAARPTTSVRSRWCSPRGRHAAHRRSAISVEEAADVGADLSNSRCIGAFWLI